MESYTVGLIIIGSTNLKRRSLIWGVVPDSDSFIDGASCNQVLLNADIHTLNGSRVEWADEVLIL
jgi:hypothetical protein